MTMGIETLVKLVLLTLLVAAGLAMWLAPKTRWQTGRQISEKLFLLTAVVGMLCGAAGLVVLFAWPARLLEWHLWELVVMPLVLVYAYWFIVRRKARTADILDEKQNLDMSFAGALTWAISIPAMSVASVLHDKGLLSPALWYPYYLFVTLLFYSAAVLYSYRRR